MRVFHPTPEPENSTLKAFQDLLHVDAPNDASLESVLARILVEGSADKALQALKRLRPRSNSPKDPIWHKVRGRLETTIQKNRNVRIHNWQLDPNRRTLRLLMAIRSPASNLNPASLGHALAQLLAEGGFPIAMGLEKKPRPMITLGPPLPLGVEGLREWADIILMEPMKLPVEICLEQINAQGPAGLRLLEGAIIPNHSSTLLELAREARWLWDLPTDLFDLARSRMDTFAASTSFEIEKTGKIEGSKTTKRIEVRAHITALEWKGHALEFATRIQPGEGLSPVKLLAGILHVEPARIRNLTRLEVILSADPRLEQACKYETKLHNIYEDAVLLESGGNIQTADEDDDDDLLVER